jgi:hypothetical protein
MIENIQYMCHSNIKPAPKWNDKNEAISVIFIFRKNVGTVPHSEILFLNQVQSHFWDTP